MAGSKTGERSFGGLIARGLWIVIAFFVSCLVGFAALIAIGARQAASRIDDGPPIDPGDPTLDNLLHYFDLVVGGTTFVMHVAPILTILPALIVIIYGEVARVRSFLFYVAGGGIATLVLPLLASPLGTSFNGQALAGFAAAGFAGGLSYWLLAGRKA